MRIGLVVALGLAAAAGGAAGAQEGGSSYPTYPVESSWVRDVDVTYNDVRDALDASDCRESEGEAFIEFDCPREMTRWFFTMPGEAAHPAFKLVTFQPPDAFGRRGSGMSRPFGHLAHQGDAAVLARVQADMRDWEANLPRERASPPSFDYPLPPPRQGPERAPEGRIWLLTER